MHVYAKDIHVPSPLSDNAVVFSCRNVNARYIETKTIAMEEKVRCAFSFVRGTNTEKHDHDGERRH